MVNYDIEIKATINIFYNLVVPQVRRFWIVLSRSSERFINWGTGAEKIKLHQYICNLASVFILSVLSLALISNGCGSTQRLGPINLFL